MTDRNLAKRRKFAHEILGLTGISALIAVAVFLVLVNIAATVAEVYCFENNVPMTEFDWIEVDRWIHGVGAVLSLSLFSILFLSMLGQRLTYIRKITQGIEAMCGGENRNDIPLEGNNELTQLADAINDMSAARQRMAEKERALAQEKDQLIRTLSHDIRTPLTSILAYSEYLAGDAAIPEQERMAHLRMIQTKAQQIRELTDILLDGSKRNLEHFADARLLMEQLAEEFAEMLEDGFQVEMDLSACERFAGNFDLRELRRIFDNLLSNIEKYADPGQPVRLTIGAGKGGLTIRQTNAIRPRPEPADSYKLGITSIRRIAQLYGGSVTVEQDAKNFAITIHLADI